MRVNGRMVGVALMLVLGSCRESAPAAHPGTSPSAAPRPATGPAARPANEQATGAGAETEHGAATETGAGVGAEAVMPETAPQEDSEPQADEPLVPGVTVRVVPLGDAFPADLLEDIARGLREEYGVDVEMADPTPLPRAAYYPPRRRYRAEKLLDHLDAIHPDRPDTMHVVGVTTVDISTTKGRHPDWGVLGLGWIDGPMCVISIYRMKPTARDRDHLEFRATTTVVHEIGHTFGLPHCEEPRCLMNDAHGKIATVDESTGHLGPGCRATLRAGP